MLEVEAVDRRLRSFLSYEDMSGCVLYVERERLREREGEREQD